MANPRRVQRALDFDTEVEIAAANSRARNLIYDAMTNAGISKAELARRLGVSPPHITQLVNGYNPITLSTLVEALDTLGYRLDMNIIPKE